MGNGLVINPTPFLLDKSTVFYETVDKINKLCYTVKVNSKERGN